MTLHVLDKARTEVDGTSVRSVDEVHAVVETKPTDKLLLVARLQISVTLRSHSYHFLWREILQLSPQLTDITKEDDVSIDEEEGVEIVEKLWNQQQS